MIKKEYMCFVENLEKTEKYKEYILFSIPPLQNKHS